MISEISLLSDTLTAGADASSDSIDLTHLGNDYSASLLIVVTGSGSVTITQEVEDAAGTLFKPSATTMTIATDFSTSSNGGKDLLVVTLPVSDNVVFHFQETSSSDPIVVNAKLIIRSNN